MKHLKNFNEASIGYHRTMGFKYSQPSEKIEIQIAYTSTYEITEEIVSDILEDIDVKNENIAFHPVPTGFVVNRIDDEGKLVRSDTIPDGLITFDIYVYNEKEVEKIMDDFGKFMNNEYDFVILDIQFKEGKKINIAD
jgi:hypothetical protein